MACAGSTPCSSHSRRRSKLQAVASRSGAEYPAVKQRTQRPEARAVVGPSEEEDTGRSWDALQYPFPSRMMESGWLDQNFSADERLPSAKSRCPTLSPSRPLEPETDACRISETLGRASCSLHTDP
jgi:hypothetical protein